MSDTLIEWADKVWNPITGCSWKSRGCDQCYAKKQIVRHRNLPGYNKDNPFRPTFHLQRLQQPKSWRDRCRVFVVSMGDLFHEDVPDSWRDKIFDVMMDVDSNHHQFMLLTKRPDVALRYYTKRFGISGFFPSLPGHDPILPRTAHIMFGISAEDKDTLLERLQIAIQIPAFRYISFEPLIEVPDLRHYRHLIFPNYRQANWDDYGRAGTPRIRGIIVGGESGAHARPMQPWAPDELRRQCQFMGIRFFFKQWGHYMPIGKITRKKRGCCGEKLVYPERYDPKKNRWFDVETQRFYRCGIINDVVMAAVGKKRAGRLLGGQTYDDHPGDFIPIDDDQDPLDF